MPYPIFQQDCTATSYQAQLEAKTKAVLARFTGFNPPELAVHHSQISHFRLRAEFRIWHDGDDCFYAMFDPVDKKTVLKVQDFPIASRLINELMGKLMNALRANALLKRKLFQVEFLTTLSGDALITLIYHKLLDEAWQEAATALQAELGVAIIGRSRKQKLVLERDWVNETLEVDGHSFYYRQLEGGFTQPNGGVNQKMLSFARECAALVNPDKSHDLLELYCGNGNFSIALADCFRQVLATEIAKTSVQAAQVNIATNQLNNLIIARLASEEFVQALRGERSFERLKGVDLSQYDFKTVLVDPPRAGLDEDSVQQIQGYDHIIYISCNPETLAENLNTLCQTHRIKRFALFDQFPYTHHAELGVLLVKRG